MMEEKNRSARKDIIDIIREKEFIGREFLTWLWFRSDSSGGVVRASNGLDVTVSFERFIMLESGEGESGETVTCRGLQASLSEGMTALAEGKKVAKAHIRLGTGDYEWTLTITGSTFDVSTLRVPKTVQAGYDDDEDLSREGRVLERAFMISTAIKTLDQLFHTFLLTRLPEDKWKMEKEEINHWIMRRAKG